MEESDIDLVKAVAAAAIHTNGPAPFYQSDEEKAIDLEPEGCGDDGLYDCPVHPNLETMSKQVKHKFLKGKYRLSEVPTDVLMQEIRVRQLAMKLTGKVSVSTKGEVSFEIDKLHWPVGVFHVNIECVEEETKSESSTSSCCGNGEQ